MAKLFGPYGSSPNCSSYALFSDWNLSSEPFCNSDFGIVDPDPIELFEDLNDWTPSIFNDIRKIQSDSSASDSSDADHCVDFFENETKPEIRNIDCMWSAQPTSATGLGGVTTSSITADGSNSSPVTAAVPLAAVIENAQNISNNKRMAANGTTVVMANSKAQSFVTAADVQIKVEPKVEPLDNDYEQQLQQHSILNSRTTQQQQQQQRQAAVNLQHIKPGMSLLRKSNMQQQQQNNKKLQQNNFTGSIKIPAKTAAEFLRERDQTTTAAAVTATTKSMNGLTVNTIAAFGRPDTPLSLDDDPIAPEFKHNVDLRACVMGSNNISLVSSDPTNIINHLSEQLQDTTKNRIDLRNLVPENNCDLADVIDLIVKDDRSLASTATPNHSSSNSGGKSVPNSSYQFKHHEYDSEEDDEDDDLEEDEYEDDHGSSCGSASGGSHLSISASLNRSLSSSAASNTSATSAYASATSPLSSVGSQPAYPIIMHSDHSYTRCNDDLGTNLETPSDSDEEIDVVSIGDKKLPTNPSDKDRRALQHKVAHKFSSARIVKTANGVRTIPPRRRITVELPYTPASSSPVKSVANSRYPSPSSTPHQNQYTNKYVQQQAQHMLQVMSDGSSTPNSIASEKQRKRVALAAPGSLINGSATVGYVEYLPPSKKHRGTKKQKQPHGGSHGVDVAGDIVQRHYSLDEAADTIEKRNLHNDMERQRRIGLKNLFEALKKQIPSIKDKERAPKVNILREAAKLCEALTREEHQLSEQKAQLKEQLRKHQDLLARLRASLQRD